MARLKFSGAFIDNTFIEPQGALKRIHCNPYETTEIFFEWQENPLLAKQAIDLAAQAYENETSGWRFTSLQTRINLLEQLKESFRKRSAAIENAIILEAGKARWEAKQETQALISKIDITITSMPKLMDAIAAEGTVASESKIVWTPRGVCAVIGPFNFPLHLANGHIIPALLAGNTVIFKPSEQTPAAACLYAEAFLEAGFPSGVFQMIPGTAATGMALVNDPRVKGIFFTGSYASGRKITEALLNSRNDLSTLAALEMGGKNASIVHEDANLHKAAIDIITAAFATAGQRCSSTSRLLVHQNIFDKFIQSLSELIKKIPVGNPFDATTFMGPLIHQKAVQNFFDGISGAKKEGFTPIIESQLLKQNSFLVSPSLYTLNGKTDISNVLRLSNAGTEHSCSWTTEFFGPNILAIPYSSHEELKSLHEASPYGLVASIFSKEQSFFDWCQQHFDIGLLHWNRSSVGASSRLPFGGYKQSGNNWPAGLFSFFYCVRPQGLLMEPNELDLKKIPEPLRLIL